MHYIVVFAFVINDKATKLSHRLQATKPGN
jgi:hypothetical protein